MKRTFQWPLLILGAAVLVVFPAVADEFWLSLLIHILGYGLLALSVDLLIGHGGLFPMGHAAFFTVAAYTVATIPLVLLFLFGMRYYIQGITSGAIKA